MYQHLAVIENSSKFHTIQINPLAYEISVFAANPNPKSELSFNVNYSWLGIPIGMVRNNSHNWEFINRSKIDLRPCLVFDINNNPSIIMPNSIVKVKIGTTEVKESFDYSKYPVITQAGPLLTNLDKNVLEACMVSQEFKEDVARRTEHVAVGVRNNKIIAVLGKGVTANELAQYFLKLKCSISMKCDGGSASYYHFKKQLGRTNVCRAGIQFVPK